MSIAEFHLLVQQARREAENPQFKVSGANRLEDSTARALYPYL